LATWDNWGNRDGGSGQQADHVTQVSCGNRDSNTKSGNSSRVRKNSANTKSQAIENLSTMESRGTENSANTESRAMKNLANMES
jgi:hypothetical protein